MTKQQLSDTLTVIALLGLILMAHIVVELLALLLPIWVQVILSLAIVLALLAALLWVCVQLAKAVR